MDHGDVIVAGGGPAGSACAWALRQAGLDVVVMDRATFPRDKVCAGWIPPQVLADLQLDVQDYRRVRTFQPFTAFRIGLVGDERRTDVDYGHPVSYGIRRSEFDSYLLDRSSARLKLGTPVTRVRRHGSMWTINESVTAPMLVGAGGHFCEVGRMLNGRRHTPDVIVAQEAEVRIADDDRLSPVTLPDRPELYFSRSFDGYGWCVRKGEYLNVGFGRLRDGPLPCATAEFVTFLKSSGVIGERASFRWKGHAYALIGAETRRLVDDGVVLVGDAAGLASRRSGEGIRPAIESGLLAASTIIRARGRYTADRLGDYERSLRDRFGVGVGVSAATDWPAASTDHLLARWLLRSPWFVRRVLLDRWFLHADDAPLAPGLGWKPPLRCAEAASASRGSLDLPSV
jgi:flavin-dependent dehydrogenase